MRAGDLIVQARLHSSGNWVTLRVRVGPITTLAMVLDTGSPVSVIGPNVRDNLLAEGRLQMSGAPDLYGLRDISIQDQPVPELAVRVLPRLRRLQVDGLLGLDFIRLFRAVHFHVDTLRLVLERR